MLIPTSKLLLPRVLPDLKLMLAFAAILWKCVPCVSCKHERKAIVEDTIPVN